ncbi:hypothetical protein S83_048153 [Arachis hypogaea]
MEDEEELKEVKLSGNGLHPHEVVDSGEKEFVDSLDQENVIATHSIKVDDVDGRVGLQGQSTVSAPTLMDEDQFEEVSLKDQDKSNEYQDSNQLPDFDNAHNLFGGNVEESKSSSGTYSIEHDSSPVVEMQRDNIPYSPGSDGQSSPTISFDSSTVNSPPKPKQKHAKPNVSPELLHLVDSAIMGKPEGVDKLKNIASGSEVFGTGEETENVAFLIVDSLLAAMGGVESFEEDEDNNPPSVMLNSRAAIVAGELIPCLPYVGDSGDFMSPRTRMVRGLLAILRACTRNRAMCSMAGLLGVLLRTAENIFTVDAGLNGRMRWDGTPLCHCMQYLAGHS